MNDLDTILRDWLLREAKWYEFWLPNSGIPGGLILGSMFFLATYIIWGCK